MQVYLNYHFSLQKIKLLIKIMKLKLFIISLFISTGLKSQTCNNVVADFCSITEGNTTHFSFSGSEEGATSYFWDFGDGNTSTLRDPIHTFSSSGTFQSCLTLTCNITSTTGGGGGYGGGGGTTTTTTCTDFLCGNISIGVNGCTDFLATNYNSLATFDDGTCDYCIYGCTISLASNYNPLANCDDNSCLDLISKFIYEDFENYDLYDYLAFKSPVWQTWNNPLSFVCSEDVKVRTGVIDSNLIGGSNAIHLKSTSVSGGPQDIILPFGTSSSYTSGVFVFSAMFNVINSMNNGGAYFNFQSDYNVGNGWALDVFMDSNEQIVFANNQNSNLLTADYPANIWFELKIAVDITNNLWYVYIDDIFLGSFSNGINQLASLDLFPLDGNSFWIDDISCMYNSNLLYGCTDSAMFNYDVNANWDDSTCLPHIYGCTDSLMFNYDLNSNTDDGSCVAISHGCLDILACNYSASANIDDGSCDFPNGCGDVLYLEYDFLVTCSDANACLTLVEYGCTDILACNYSSFANTDDGNCNYNSESYDTLVSSIAIIWNSISLTNSGNYSVSLVNSVGCDSIANLSFTIINTTAVEDIYNNNVLINITNILGQQTPYRRNIPLFYIYKDGTVEKKIIIQ